MNPPVLNGSNVLTHSRMQCYKTCPRKHQLRYEIGLRPERSSTPLRFGSAVHAGLDVRAQGMSVDEAVDIASAGYEVLPDWCNNDELIYSWRIERETVRVMLAMYFWYWETAQSIPDNLNPAAIIETEKVFNVSIINPDTGRPSRTFTVSGKRDKLVTLADGRVAVMEHKTTSDSLEPDSDYWRRLKIDQQISLYMLAAKDQGIDAATVLYDVIRKPTIKPRMVPDVDSDGCKVVLDQAGERVKNRDGSWKQAGDTEKGYFLQQRRETPQEWRERLHADIESRPEWYFARQEIPRISSDLDEFRRELWQQAQDIGNARKSGLWYRNAGACTGMFRCEYFDVCTSNANVADGVPGFEFVGELHPELAGGD